MVVFIASRSPLPLVPWNKDEPSFNVADLDEHEERVRTHLSRPHIRYAGSHTRCGCGFNEGRQYPQTVSDPKVRADALESASRLAKYVREHHVEELYSCWSGDEAQPKEFDRHITPEALTTEDFFFRERELLRIDHGAP